MLTLSKEFVVNGLKDNFLMTYFDYITYLFIYNLIY